MSSIIEIKQELTDEQKKTTEAIKNEIRLVQDWPKPGIGFRDINPFLNNSELFAKGLDIFVARYKDAKIDYFAGIESRGFIFSAPLAHALGCGFLMLRKPSKLPPGDKIDIDYGKEYGKDVLELYVGGFDKEKGMDGARVVVFDDLIATGGSCLAACKLIEKAGGKIAECAFLIGLPELKGDETLAPRPCFSLVEYDDKTK
mmetsp:Transcript_20128/g.29938  ORF Transcript_20128/g.29938 Transcript_20128/m.29938 type:complete len:201 (-) Transcript_20128:35-637(-)